MPIQIQKDLNYFVTTNEIVAIVSRVDNGFVITYIDQEADEPSGRFLVFQEVSHPDLHVITKFLEKLLEILEVSNDKYKLEIKVIKNDSNSEAL